MIRCPGCLTDKAGEDFYVSASARGGRQRLCKPCVKAEVARWQRENPGKHWQKQRRSNLKRYYGLTEQGVQAMLAKQEGRCAICRRRIGIPGLKVDHCHASGKVRGLLCGPCNRSLGLFRDSIAHIKRAVAYLDR